MSSTLLKIKCSLLSLCMVVATLASTPTLSQELNVDIDVPKINQVEENIGVLGEPQTIVATVNDDRAVRYVTLFYRYGESGEFIAEPMKQTAASTYSATLQTSDETTSSIQYYVKAADTSGNITFRGYSSSPKTLQPTPQAIEQSDFIVVKPVVAESDLTQANSTKPTQTSKSNRTLYTVLGVLGAIFLVGAVAGSSGGGGGGVAENVGTVTVISTNP